MNCCKIKDKAHATQMFKTLTNTLYRDVLHEVFTIFYFFYFIMIYFISFLWFIYRN